MRFFNTAGPVREDDHYCLPPLERFDLDEIMLLIEQKKYFVLHAPRQTGKTSYLLALMKYLNQTGHYHCLYINVEAAQAMREDVSQTMQVILNELILRSHSMLKDSFFDDKAKFTHLTESSHLLNTALSLWAEATPKPIVLFIDEIDSLIGDSLISVLRQLRSGYDKRPQFFPQSIILCGVRDVRDYRIHTADNKPIITGGSAFNIKAESLRLGNFTAPEINTLFQQHTQETGQVFEPEAVERVWYLTRGQPWLVNALGYEVTMKMKANRNRSVIITTAMIEQAKENLILRRETHLDQLVDKLKEPRVRHVIEPLLNGGGIPDSLPEDDIQYVYDLGLITKEGSLQIANPIYQEVIPRTLTYGTQVTITHESSWYVMPTGQLDMSKLLAAFQQFFREHSEHWVERFDYKEAGPQLLLQAFLQRIVNGGGRIEREYGLGRKRTDLLVLWPYGESMDAPTHPFAHSPMQRAVLELKILSKSLDKTIAEGLTQTWEYMDRCGATEGHLIIFDRRAEVSWDEKIFQHISSYQGHPIQVWGM